MIYKELKTFKDCDYNGIQKTQKRTNFLSLDDSKKPQSILQTSREEVDEIVKILNNKDDVVLGNSGS